MSLLFQKLSELHRVFSNEKGPFVLFGLFLPEDAAPDRWDLVLSAPWLPENWLAPSRPLFKRLQEKLSPEEVLLIDRVVILEPSEPFVQSLRDLAFRGQGLELGNGAHIVAPAVRGSLQVSATDYVGGITTIGNDWVELPASTFKGIPFKRVVLFHYDPDLIPTVGSAATAGAR